MKINFLSVVPFVALLGVGAMGCGSSAESVTCSFDLKVGTTEIKSCATEVYTGTADESSGALDKACTGGGGKVVTSCPTAGLVGTCTYSANDFTYSTAYYSGTAAEDEMGCKALPKAVWKAK